MKRIISYIVAVSVGWALAGCSIGEPEHIVPVEGDELTAGFSVAIDAPVTVETKSVDPDGEGIQMLWLFLFDEDREYLGHVRAQELVHDAGQGTGSFTARIVSTARHIHFVANYNSSDIDDGEYIGRTDLEVMTSFTSSSGRLVYWGYESFASEDELAGFASGSSGPVTMYRNQAAITYSVETQDILVNGFAVCNKYARGTVVPYNPDSSDPFDFSLDLPYVTLCDRDESVKATDPTETIVMNEWGLRYVFEHDNRSDDQIYAIFNISVDGGSTWKYYKLLLCDPDGNPYPVIRNHRYVFRFSGVPSSLGYGTFAEAAEGIPANNVWVSIDEELPSIGDGSTRLSIEGETARIYTEQADEKIYFTYLDNDGRPAEGNVFAEWLSNEGVAAEDLQLEYDSGTGRGSVTVSLNVIGQSPQYGTLRIKAGKYSRDIEIIYLRNFDFSPVWMTTSVAEKKGESVSIMFHIPDDYPESLFPVECKISCDLFDVNAASSGNSGPLDVIVEKTEFNIDGQTETKDWNYKYVYYADSPGAQRIDFVTASDKFADDGAWYLEAPYFNTVKRTIYSVPAEQENQKILFSNNTGTMTVDIPPVRGHEFEVRFRLDGGTPEGTRLRVYTDSSIEPVDDLGAPQTGDDAGVFYYYTLGAPGQDGYYTLLFRTVTAYSAGYVRLAAAQADNPDLVHCYKSAIVTRNNTPKEYDFGFGFADGGNTVPEISLPYGEGIGATLRFTYDRLDGVNASGQSLPVFFIGTDGLVPVPGSETERLLVPVDGGYEFSLSLEQLEQGGSYDLEMQTSAIVSAGPVSISEVSGALLFNEKTLAFSNYPVQGTVEIDSDGFMFGTSAPFIALEKADGTRIGSFSVKADPQSASGTYKLTLYKEYDFSADESLTVVYSPIGEVDIFIAHITVGGLLSGSTDIVLARQL